LAGAYGAQSSDAALVSVITSMSGGAHSLALKTDGSVWAWGSNAYGQLGDGSRSDKLSPVRVMDAAVEIAAGGNASAAIKPDGGVYTWGYNAYGQLGDGTRADKLSPALVLSGARTAAAAPQPDATPGPGAPVTAPAVPTPSRVVLNGTALAFDAYNIDGSNYFKLRDLAFALRDTDKRFSVDFYEEQAAVALTVGGRYAAVGDEMAAGNGRAQSVAPSTHGVFLNGRPVSPAGYNIAGSNYYKLRDIMALLDVYVGWDAAGGTITLDTGRSYVD
jgi:hypothetical protein